MTELSLMPNALDEKMQQLIERLKKFQILRQDVRFDPILFHSFKQRIAGKMDVPSTTISKVMERLLFSISSSESVGNSIVLGSYCGYAMLWLAAGKYNSPSSFIHGFDINADACQQAEHNMRVAGLQHATIINRNAYEAADLYENDSVDLLFLDVENNGKSDYAPLLQQWMPKLATGAIVLAHDPLVSKFKNDFEAYHELVQQKDLFLSTLTLPIDECGVEISICK
ncbi:O-methyltransferase [Paenibacillus kandeliae]|uniref:O-methyltransferase n=1 Tax=Paenibacillus kandeliae TaxID=3231269 RepID=UPI00345763D7